MIVIFVSFAEDGFPIVTDDLQKMKEFVPEVKGLYLLKWTPA